MKSELFHLSVLGPKGKKSRKFVPPTELPSDLVPGEFLMIPDATTGKHQWYVFCDKQRFWDSGRWHLTGTIVSFDPSKLTEPEVYELRRSLLKQCGWIG